MKATQEQEEILKIARNMEIGDILIVNALAGCAKTTTLKMIAEENLDSRFLYLAFNRAIVEDAREKFPDNTKATTLHGLARGYEGRKEIKALTINLVAEILNKNVENKNDYFKVFNALKAYDKFCNSHISISELEQLEAEIIAEANAEFRRKPKQKNSDWIIEQRIRAISKVEEIHEYILNSDFTTFGTFMKEFVDSSDGRNFNYDYIVLDESQDISRLLAKFIMSISNSGKYKIIVVGDNNQKIYGFLGNINLSDVLETLYPENVIKRSLSQSFRFQNGSEMEVLSNKILNLRQENITGFRQSFGEEDRNAFVSRTKFPLLAMAIYLIQKKEKFNLLGGVKDFNTQEIKDIYSLYLYSKKVEKEIFNFSNLTIKEQINALSEVRQTTSTPFPIIKTKSLQPFNSFLDLEIFAETRMIYELQDNINMALFIHSKAKNMNEITNIQHNVQHLVEQFFSMLEKYFDPESKTVLSTIHKTKGLEFENVTILKFLSIIRNDDDIWQTYESSTGRIIGLDKEELFFRVQRGDVSNRELTDIFNRHGNNEKSIFQTPQIQDEYEEEEEFSSDIRSNKVSYELKINTQTENIKEEYNILYVAITRAIKTIQISNVHYKTTLEFLDFIHANIEELVNIVNGKESYLLENIAIRKKIIPVVIYKDSFIRIETLKEFLPKI
jgi:superfamily I DNA/RNA helicase